MLVVEVLSQQWGTNIDALGFKTVWALFARDT